MPKVSATPSLPTPSDDAIARTQAKVFDSTLFRRRIVKLQNALTDLLEGCPKDLSNGSMGYLRLRLLSGSALHDGIAQSIDGGSLDPDIVRFATFTFRDGYRDIDDPATNFNTQAGRIDRLCREFGVSAFVMPDIELIKFAGYGEPVLSGHHHALIWNSDGTPIQPELLSAAMNKRLAGQGLVLPPVEISAHVPGQAAIERVIAIASYATKITCRLKAVWWRDDGSYDVKSSTRNISAERVLRVLHAWSCLDILDNVRAVGQGKVLRKPWKANLENRLRNVRKDAGRSCDQLEQLWSEFWGKSGLPAPTPDQLEARATKFDTIAALAEDAAARRTMQSAAIKRIRKELRNPYQTTLKDL